MNTVLDPADLQGNILRGYRRARVRYLVLEIVDRIAARQWMGAATAGGHAQAPQITTEAQWEAKPAACFNIGLSFEGLRALGTPAASLGSFPTEFSSGMPSRATKLGDTGSSAPQHWAPPFDVPETIHLIASIYADDIGQLDLVQAQVLAGSGGRAFRLRGTRDGWNFNGDTVHFGYRDNISQPRFPGIRSSEKHPDRHPDQQPTAPLGTVLLGHDTAFEGLTWRVPSPEALGMNGSFNAFRILAQDVAGFEACLDDSASQLLGHPSVDELLPPGAEASFGAGLSRHAALREVVAAKMCGRWRNGLPLTLSPETPNPAKEVSLTDFDYGDDDVHCPYGAHIRRCNPRGAAIVQRMANHTRRLVRRGIPYGPAYDPAKPDAEERGLLGNFIGANLGAQFEAMSCDWLNLGLQDPRITGSNDPLLGANDPKDSWFDIPLASGATIRLRGLARFVQTRGGAYTFLPSIPALRYLASLTG